MEQQNQAIFTAQLSEQISACTFSKADLQALCEILQESSDEAAKEEINHYRPLDRNQEHQTKALFWFLVKMKLGLMGYTMLLWSS